MKVCRTVRHGREQAEELNNAARLRAKHHVAGEAVEEIFGPARHAFAQVMIRKIQEYCS
jgi:hypothetical protein